MLEALWSVEFVSDSGSFGAGVIVLESSRLYGGDSQYYYLGTFKVVHDTLEAEITINHYSGPGISIFGNTQKEKIKLSGKYAANTFDLSGHLVDKPERKILVRLTKRADLP